MKSFIMCAAAVLGMALVGTTQAEAGHGYNSHHSSHSSHNGYNNFSNHYNNYGYNQNSWRAPSYYNNGHNFNSQFYAPSYHNTSHSDYHAPSLQRHGYHLDVVPGHYDYHRSGHYDF